MTLDPTQYDFLWKVEHMSFPFHSMWLTKEVTQRDFIITCQQNAWKVYIGKEERRRLGIVGYRLLRTSLPAFIQDARRLSSRGAMLLRQQGQIELKELTNRQLRRHFLQLVTHCRRLWSQYFRTEYFCYDLVDARIRRGGPEASILRARVRRMQKIKLKLREQLNEIGFGAGIGMAFVREIARRRAIARYDDWSYQELDAVLLEKRPHVPNRSTYVVGKKTNWHEVTGTQARRLITRLEKAVLPRAGGMLMGQVGNRGFYRGRVKIIPFDLTANHTGLIATMKKGDVLVTGSTGPEMILACKKAGAIVTEEGGITSHAAIVSRELNIPCVIGTKVATEVLNNGDYVEVDAERGTVRLLYRHQ